MTALPPLKSVIDALPEMYQPIYGHPEFSANAARKDDRRFRQIMDVHDALARQLNRPVRVLDLGCAQGWFSFNLANAGAKVLGVDYQAANINVCNMLALENRGLHARFNLLEIEKVPALLDDDQFDLVLGLSVFHHLCAHNGIEATRDLLGKIFEKIPVCLLELALADEPMPWASAQPQSHDYLIEQMPFFRILSYHPTHLTPVDRPLYFGSRRFWYVDGEMGEFSTWTGNAHGRRYFFGADRLVKLYRVTGEHAAINHHAIARAAHFLGNPPQDYVRTPKLFHSGAAHDAAWLVQEKIDGTMLGDMMNAGTPYDARMILLGILKQLAALEKIGLFHADIRVWNVLVDSEGFPLLIDYNEISTVKSDCVWPDSLFLAFFIFVNEVVSRRQWGTELGRSPFISPYNLPEPYRFWGAQLWQRPVGEWRFAFLLESLENLPQAASDDKGIEDPNALWMQAVERNINSIHETIDSMNKLIRQIHAIVIADHQIAQRQHAQDTNANRANK